MRHNKAKASIERWLGQASDRRPGCRNATAERWMGHVNYVIMFDCAPAPSRLRAVAFLARRRRRARRAFCDDFFD